MKLAIFVMMMAFAPLAQASQVGCNTTMQIEVAGKASDLGFAQITNYKWERSTTGPQGIRVSGLTTTHADGATKKWIVRTKTVGIGACMARATLQN